jgi:hypothetical protein
MAIKSNYTSDRLNTTVSDAYVKISNINIHNNHVNVDMNVYLNEASRQNNGVSIENIHSTHLLAAVEAAEGDNLVQKTYNVIKAHRNQLNLGENLTDI